MKIRSWSLTIDPACHGACLPQIRTLGDFLRRVWVCQLNKMSIFCQTIHYYHYRVLSKWLRQSVDEVEGDVFPDVCEWAMAA